MRKIPKTCAPGFAPVQVARPQRSRRRTIGPPTRQERVDMAFLAALTGLPDQRARSLASDALVRRTDLKKAARAVVRAAERAGWEDWRSLAVLASYGGVKVGLPRGGEGR